LGGIVARLPPLGTGRVVGVTRKLRFHLSEGLLEGERICRKNAALWKKPTEVHPFHKTNIAQLTGRRQFVQTSSASGLALSSRRSAFK
jgi:hypothetical protein